MSWLALVGTVLNVLLPVLKDWLQKLIDRSGQSLEARGVEVNDGPSGVKRLMREVRANMTFSQWLFNSGSVDRVEKVLLRRAGAIYSVARGEVSSHSDLQLTGREVRELSL